MCRRGAPSPSLPPSGGAAAAAAAVAGGAAAAAGEGEAVAAAPRAGGGAGGAPAARAARQGALAEAACDEAQRLRRFAPPDDSDGCVSVTAALLAATHLNLTTATAAKRACRRGEVFVDGKRAYVHTRVLREGSVIERRRREASSAPLEVCEVPEGIRSEVAVLYEDDHVLVLRKPAGVETVAKNGWHMERVAAHYSQQTHVAGAIARPRAAHRLDRPVGGVCCLAKTRDALAAVGKEFAERRCSKTYYALAAGKMELGAMVVDAPLKKKGTGAPLPAVTEVEALAHTHSTAHGSVTLVRLRPRTGYFHQLRLHLAGLGHPILGDKQHGRGGFFGNKAAFERSQAQAAAAGVGGLYLFSARLEVPLETCPGGRLVAEAPLPARFEARREWEASGAAEAAAAEDDVGV